MELFRAVDAVGEVVRKDTALLLRKEAFVASLWSKGLVLKELLWSGLLLNELLFSKMSLSLKDAAESSFPVCFSTEIFWSKSCKNYIRWVRASSKDPSRATKGQTF